MKIGLIHNWPGVKNSELDLIGRISVVLESIGHVGEPICPFGHRLDFDGNYLKNNKNNCDYDFVINFHFTSANYTEAPSYVCNWNPVSFLTSDPTNQKQLTAELQNLYRDFINSNSFVMSAGSNVVDEYIEYSYVNKTVPAIKSTPFYTTCQIFEDKVFNWDKPKIFYIGVNWEKLQGTDRHDGLFGKLDASNKVDFYGVKSINGIELWDGISNYQGELPFDNGHSIVNTANKCGISLVLSTNAHKESELVSTRIFQACAAKTVLICDDNPFITKYFGDCSIQLNLTGEPVNDATEILDAYEWLIENPEKAKEYAEKSHKRFVEAFSLEPQVEDLICHYNHCKNDFLQRKYSVTVYCGSIISDDNLHALNNALDNNYGISVTLLLPKNVDENINKIFQSNRSIADIQFADTSDEVMRFYRSHKKIETDFYYYLDDNIKLTKSFLFESILKIEEGKLDVLKLTGAYSVIPGDDLFNNYQAIEKFIFHENISDCNAKYFIRSTRLSIAHRFSHQDIAKRICADSKNVAVSTTPSIIVTKKDGVQVYNYHQKLKRKLQSREARLFLIKIKEKYGKYWVVQNLIIPITKKFYRILLS